MKEKVKLHFLGGVGMVTGSNFMIDTPETKILIDCGLLQGCHSCEEKNREPFPYDPSKINFLFITHAHIDHIGRVPKLVRDGFGGRIYSTHQTKQIAALMFADALSIMKQNEKETKLPPLYDESDIEKALSLWQGIDYKEEIIAGDFKVSMHSAGHILGSALVEIERDGKILFTGDLGNSNNLLLEKVTMPQDVDYLVTESVYGDRNHETVFERKEKLLGAINKTLEKGGPLIIPAFSLERTQHILFEINNLVEAGEVEPLPVYLDSPLAIKLTEIYRQNPELFKKSVRQQIEEGDDIFDFPKLELSLKKDQSEEIWNKPDPKIILAGSGMSMGGRVVAHEKKYLSDPKTTILFVGYQAVGSLGRRIEEGDKKVKITGEEIKVRAEILKVGGYSSHRDSDGLVEFVQSGKENLKKAFVVMGEPKSSTFLAQRLKEELDVNAIVPENGEVQEINI